MYIFCLRSCLFSRLATHWQDYWIYKFENSLCNTEPYEHCDTEEPTCMLSSYLNQYGPPLGSFRRIRGFFFFLRLNKIRVFKKENCLMQMYMARFQPFVSKTLSDFYRLASPHFILQRADQVPVQRPTEAYLSRAVGFLSLLMIHKLRYQTTAEQAVPRLLITKCLGQTLLISTLGVYSVLRFKIL